MNSKTNVVISILVTAILLVGAVAAVFFATPLGTEFGNGYTLSVSTDYLTDEEFAALEKSVNDIVGNVSKKLVSKQTLTSQYGSATGMIYTFYGLTDADIATLKGISELSDVVKSSVSKIDTTGTMRTLIFLAISLGGSIVLAVLYQILFHKKLGRAAGSLSILYTLLLEFLFTASISVVIGLIGARVSLTTVASLVAIVLYGILTASFILSRANRLIQIEKGNLDSTVAKTLADTKKANLFATLSVAVVAVVLCAVYGFSFIGFAVPVLFGVLAVGFANSKLLLTFWQNIAEKN